MKTSGASKGLTALIDANVNRAKEGLRVCEDISRFILRDKKLSACLKSMRHDIDNAVPVVYARLLKSRDSETDPGRGINIASEFRRSGFSSVLASNFKRCQESLRVLEEVSKLYKRKSAGLFKELRYRAYTAEKKALKSREKKT